MPNLHITGAACTVLFSRIALRSEVSDRGEGRTGIIPGRAACSCAPTEHDRRNSALPLWRGTPHSTHPPPYVAHPPMQMQMRISNTDRPSTPSLPLINWFMCSQLARVRMVRVAWLSCNASVGDGPEHNALQVIGDV